MDIYLIISIILVILVLGLTLFGGENLSHKIYHAVSASAMALIGTLAFKMVNP